jgi:hypothetical protein
LVTVELKVHSENFDPGDAFFFCSSIKLFTDCTGSVPILSILPDSSKMNTISSTVGTVAEITGESEGVGGGAGGRIEGGIDGS